MRTSGARLCSADFEEVQLAQNCGSGGSISVMESARGLYSRLAGVSPDHDLDEGMDSLLSLPKVSANHPREWLHIDPHIPW